MIVGILKEIKTEENRVCMTPAGAEVMKMNGHQVLVEKRAGVGSGFEDSDYATVGAELVATPQEIYERADMVMHVKEPLPSEYDMIREGQIVFTYLHLAAAEELTLAMMKSGCIGIAYETIQKADRSLPLLTPMSEVAGRMAIQEGAKSWSASGRAGCPSWRCARCRTRHGRRDRRRGGGDQCGQDGLWSGRQGVHPGYEP